MSPTKVPRWLYGSASSASDFHSPSGEVEVNTLTVMLPRSGVGVGPAGEGEAVGGARVAVGALVGVSLGGGAAVSCVIGSGWVVSGPWLLEQDTKKMVIRIPIVTLERF